ncbi:hypothetical protein PMI36_03025 [Pseudomonas sp. GM79]|nr:hypothetical protein PMI36_03025 [Pseudomonas sp. GM79]
MLGRGDGADYPPGADLYPFCAEGIARDISGGNKTVGAAEGCDLLILSFKNKVKRSQPAAAPTGIGCTFNDGV